MARSPLYVAVGVAFFVSLLVSHFVINLGFSQAEIRQERVDQKQGSFRQTYSFTPKDAQANDAPADATQYLIGVGKADVTG